MLILASIVGVVGHRAFRAKPLPYRQHLNSIEGSDAWFRVGSYSVVHDGSTIEFDLYYSDSDVRPDGSQNVFPYPNTFGLYCVWQRPNGSWSHKELSTGSRTTFHKIVGEKPDEIELQLRSKFRVPLSGSGEEGFEDMKRMLEANQPYSRKLMFENGEPVLKILTDKISSGMPEPPDAG